MGTIRDGAKISGLLVGGLVLGLIALLLVASMGIFGWGFFQRSTANFRGQTGAIEKTKANANFRIASYDHFFDLCSAVQGEEGRIAAQTELLASSTGAEAARVRTNIAALQGARTADINQYNADAAKGFTEGQFRDSKLPYHLDPQAKETTCSTE